ncbi:MaoC/PaaZ C-terminal domain-containing protein [Gilvimarinus sp. SDUM040013]|uniref:MaoC/PaaZ C-terminal domain-containing protein n=1 Tax=Gilvimarinus gilvus TaxID=3058038 RepID=A0ABU4S3H0_9GAMM|nr:MaoC/PaaZ C-terminal domain-containing protein [Gilvimarinus sp. SDUM040013]MDO3387815.1 MaoC/PaaZ C-terminal domain-containing protein [Gilvimarinus sp. SDUM040013]MDX6851042.1 MaoC/PaaZ C-terminal domain-containing protein [Gilvimarinus sp. SDUM040013]
MSEVFTVTSQSPCVQGHFPGAPIAPGAYLLGMIHKTFIERFPESVLTQFGKVKFQGAVLPGDEVRIVWDESRWPKGKVQLLVAGECRLTASFTAQPNA